MTDVSYRGLLLIGDPHLKGRQPGFRKDDYPSVILDKLAWCLEYAAVNRLLPAILGDLFDKPRDNPNWMIVRLMELLKGEVIGLYGNHDCADPELKDHDSLSLLVQSDRLRLVSEQQPWQGLMNGRQVVVGGSSYRHPLPKRYPPSTEQHSVSSPLVIWLTHHDILIPGYDKGNIRPREIPGVDVVVNGHIHHSKETIQAGRTAWITPGNISRLLLSDVNRVPFVLRIDVSTRAHELLYVEVPHRPFDEVFHDLAIEESPLGGESAFVTGLAELQARRTASGAGLRVFLEQNMTQFAPPVANEIMRLAQEILNDGGK